MMKFGKVISDIKTVQQLKDAIAEFDADAEIKTVFDEPLEIKQLLDYDSGEKLYVEICGSDT